MGSKDQLRNAVMHGFTRIKADMEALRIRMMLLEAENMRLKEQLQELKNQKESEKVLQNSESQPSLNEEKLRLRISEIVSEALRVQNTKVESSVSAETASISETESLREEVFAEELSELKKAASISEKRQAFEEEDKLKEDLLRSYERNRKQIVKQNILAEASKANLTKIELRDIVVRQKKYCSKASFYRYLEELELEGLLETKRRNKKNILLSTLSHE